MRFGSGRFDDAVRQFLSFITNDARHAEPVYLADPCFGGDFSEVGFAKLFADLCAAINQQPLRVLSAARRPPDGPPWWAHDLGKSRADVRVRSFVNRTSERRCLHDRYLITPAREILMTNSLHRWGRLGVTFVSLPYGTYRAEAERLWGLEPDTPTADVIVREFL